jgi:hypothetical protein
MLPCCALQISPISPLALSYHASGGPMVGASPTSQSVIVSTISCEATEVWFPKTVLLPHPELHPPPNCMSG